MSNLTRRFKKYKKNRTSKRNRSIKSGGEGTSEREGIIDIFENKVSSAASLAGTTLADAGLKIIGLERVNKSAQEDEDSKRLDENINKVSDTTLGIVSNVVDKTGSAIIENVNEVLGSDAVKQTTEQAAQDTSEIVKKTAEKFNEALNKPEVKAEVEEAIENAGEVAAVVVKAAKEPFNEAVDIAAEATQKATGAALSGAVKVGTDVLAAVPFFGAIIDLGKMVNDGSRAASAMVEAGSETTEAASDALIQTTENIQKGLKELEDKKKVAQQISNRTTNSIKEFETPMTAQTPMTKSGGYKTRRRLINRKAKSKRVRFAI